MNRYSIHPYGDGYRVWDSRTNGYTKSRFHHKAEAMAWVVLHTKRERDKALAHRPRFTTQAAELLRIQLEKNAGHAIS